MAVLILFLAGLWFTVIQTYEMAGDIREFYAGLVGTIGLFLAFRNKPDKVVTRPIGFILIAVFVWVHFQIGPTSPSALRLVNNAAIVAIIASAGFLFFLFRGGSMGRGKDKPATFDALADEVSLDTGIGGLAVKGVKFEMLSNTTAHLRKVADDLGWLKQKPSEVQAMVSANQEASRQRVPPVVYQSPEFHMTKLMAELNGNLKKLEVDLKRLEDHHEYELSLQSARDLDQRKTYHLLDMRRELNKLYRDLEQIAKNESTEATKQREIELTKKAITVLERDINAAVGQTESTG